jgi:hypothetical protein
MFTPDPGSGYFSIPDPGVIKAPNPGSATLEQQNNKKVRANAVFKYRNKFSGDKNNLTWPSTRYT